MIEKLRKQFMGRPGDKIETGHRWEIKAIMPPDEPEGPYHPRMAAVHNPVMTIVLVRCEGGGDECGWLATIALEGRWTMAQLTEEAQSGGGN